MSEEKPVVLVTGASRGLGRAIAIDFGKRDYHVIVNYRREHREAQTTAEAIRLAGGTVELRQADISKAEDLPGLFHDLKRLDVLVNNAGITRDELLIMMKAQSWNSVMETNLTAVFRCTKFAANLMLAAKGGTIVNIGSSSAMSARVGQANYCSAKAAMLGYTRSLARELAPAGIRVVTVAPGFTVTDMAESVSEKASKEAMERIPLGRWAKPKEVVSAVAFAASSAARCFTGHTLLVDGGRTSFEVECAL